MIWLAIDPGKTTGLCIGHKDGVSLTLRPLQHEFNHRELWDYLDTLGPESVICESFEYRNRARAGLDLTPVELIGVIKLWAHNGVPLYLQSAAQGKGHFSDQKLKDRGVYKRGVPHGMDATRHLLHWYTFGAGYKFSSGDATEYSLADDTQRSQR